MELLAKLTLNSVKGEIRVEKMLLLIHMQLEASKSRIHGPMTMGKDFVREAKELLK